LPAHWRLQFSAESQRAARLDLVGFMVLAMLSGLGGGMIRDTLLQRGTPVALRWRFPWRY
jgi:uncharacterized membrane protein YeiH